MPSSERPLPTWWIKIWIVIGCFAFALLFAVPFLMSRNVTREYERYQACVERRRADCEPSMIWLLSDWKMSTSTTILDTSLTPTPSSTPPFNVLPTSTVSIHIPDDLQNENDPNTQLKYIQVPRGQAVPIRVQTPNSVNRVEVFVTDMLSSYMGPSSTIPTLVLTKQRNGLFTGSWTYPVSGFNEIARLEIRAYVSARGSADANAKYDQVTHMVAIKK